MQVVKRVVDTIVPPRMGLGFRWLLSSEWLNNLGDGIALAAGPLLIASQTRNPALVAMGALMQWVPAFLFALYAGWIADRVDRRRLVLIADSLRALVLTGLVAVIWSGQISIPVVLACLFLLGTTETFVDTGSSTLMPMLVEPEDLGVANARMSFGRKTLNELIGPPIGAALFVGGLATPFVAQAVLVGLGAVLISRLGSAPPAEVSATKGIRSDVAAGMKWLWRNPPIRTLTLTIVLFNLTFGAMWPMLVLYADERLGLGEVGFGVLLSAGAVGGAIGAAGYGWLEAQVSLSSLMRAGLIVETFVHLGLVLSTSPLISMAVVFAFGFQASIWGTTATAVRQRAVPEDFQGRVGGVYLVGVYGGLVVGNAIGATIAGLWGILAPFWFGFGGSALMLAIIWRQLPQIAHADSG